VKDPENHGRSCANPPLFSRRLYGIHSPGPAITSFYYPESIRGSGTPTHTLGHLEPVDTLAILPEHIIVSVFSVPDGSKLGSFPIPKTGPVCLSADTCEYRTSIEGQDFPSGTFMLSAEDPLSGATNRQIISIPLHREVKSEFLKKYEHEQEFTLTSLTIGVFLLVVLAVMVRQ
jgi:hypothetical protein